MQPTGTHSRAGAPSVTESARSEEQIADSSTRPESAGRRQLRQWLLPLLVLALGLGVAALLKQAKPKEGRAPKEQVARLVSVQPLEPKALRARVVGRGVVEPEREVVLVPEVTGKIVHVSKNLISGGEVKQGEILLRIDPRSYQQEVHRLQGALSNAELQVEVEKNQRELAEYESQLLGQVGQRSRVATRESHVEAAEASVKAQQSAVASARLNLQRTVIKAPFDATVVAESVEIGQVVHAQSQVAQLVASAELRVEVSLPLEDLTMFSFPSGSEPGSLALVRQALPRNQTIEREGRVSRLVQQLDERTRRARVLVTVKDPFDAERGLPLLPGAHVEVEIQGKQLPALVAIERGAVYDGDAVWVVGKDKKLKRRPIEIVWSDRERVYAKPTFAPDERVVTTLLSTPIQGMPVRVQQSTPAAAVEQAVATPGG